MEERKTKSSRWDPIVKLTHWGVAGLIICNALIVGEGSIAHIYAGYFLAGLLFLRLIWGFVGPTSARFASFPPSPRQALVHIGDLLASKKAPHVSHNPLGALMAYALWACLSVIIASGIAMAGPPPKIAFPTSISEVVQEGEHQSGEQYEEEYEESEADEVFEEAHEIAVNLLYVLIFLHILGVVFETARSGRRTVTSMLPGGK
ncbi:cytochrome b/b6 domain-containing protein [Erythrobacter sp. SCSIO 43205]|uniref:cytochrome b/b6 domain-containing protein n=1 Tax=Erythrobacter sp. SCSIO 43205 TaxID=2779361 RepID=UPI001CA9802E|nr:cytochrome b/b6 domain-containing protein [Erythrobacter sp. SCSIO 43205]UAB79288.1 cytochrome b/b6 domain-containing protein [Erythrobacter sp. SCSIO 43205]